MNLTNAQMIDGLTELIASIDETLAAADEQRRLEFELNEEIKERASA